MTKKPCDHTNLQKIEKDKEQDHSLFKCLGCGRLIAMDKHICALCGGLPVDDINDHMLRVHDFDRKRCGPGPQLDRIERIIKKADRVAKFALVVSIIALAAAIIGLIQS